MLRIRRFEAKCVELYQAQKIRGFLHLYDGEEAVAVGVMAALAPRDAVVATYREHGHALARGVPMNTHPGRDAGQAGRLQPRPRRLDAPVRPPAPLLRRQCHRRRRPAAGRRPRAGRPAPAPGRGHRLLLRRRRGGRRRLPRDHEPGRAVEAAGAVRLREQPLRHGRAAGTMPKARPTSGARPRPTACRPSRWTAWTRSKVEAAARRAVEHMRARPGARTSWSAAPTASARIRCSTPRPTAQRDEIEDWKHARPDRAAAQLDERQPPAHAPTRPPASRPTSPPRSLPPWPLPRPARWSRWTSSNASC